MSPVKTHTIVDENDRDRVRIDLRRECTCTRLLYYVRIYRSRPSRGRSDGDKQLTTDIIITLDAKTDEMLGAR